MDEESARVFLPPRERCFERLRLARFGETVTCVHCESEDVVKRGTTCKDAQQYWCTECETYFHDLTNTIFDQHRFDLEEMFYIVNEMRSEPTAQIVRDRDRDYEAVLNFVHDVQDVRVRSTNSTCMVSVKPTKSPLWLVRKESKTKMGVRARTDSHKGARKLRDRQPAKHDTRRSL